MDTWTVRRSPRKLNSWWKTKKEEPNKIKSYLGRQGQNVKKDEITQKEERRKRNGTHKIQKEKHRVRIVTKKDHMNKSFFYILMKCW